MSEETDDPITKLASHWSNEIYSTRRLDVPPILYHYTDASGLTGTLRASAVWATDFRFLNDKQELRHGLDLGRAVLTKNRKRSASNDKLVRFYDEALSYADIESTNVYYVFSLSTEADDLSQWRGYAREGQGFTLGFSGPELCRHAEPEDGEFALVKVVYDESVQTRSIERALDEMEKVVLSELSKEAVNESEVLDQAAREADSIIEGLASVYKHKSFKGENEWRLITVCDTQDPDEDVKVRVSGLQLVPYVILDITDAGDKLPLKRVGVGPGFAGSEVTRALESLLAETGYKLDVYPADTPYRRA